jgi:hypothetical protein
MSTEGNWGEWMGGWKTDIAGGKDGEAARIDRYSSLGRTLVAAHCRPQMTCAVFAKNRQKAAFGAETIAKLKDLHVLIIGLRGVGVEAAKNLILSNVGGVVVWDPVLTRSHHAVQLVLSQHCCNRSERPCATSARTSI